MAAVLFRSTHGISSRMSGCSLKEQIQSSKFRLMFAQATLRTGAWHAAPARANQLSFAVASLSVCLYLSSFHPGFKKSRPFIKSIRCKHESDSSYINAVNFISAHR